MNTSGAAPTDVEAGARLFARYAYAPNKLGYCGPEDSASVLGYGATGSSGATVAEEVRVLARRFHGAWPYLVILARLSGIDDPLDRRIVEAYWLGGGIGYTVDNQRFGETLLQVIGKQAGHYWKYLTPELLPEAAPNHCFHVFGVYPWSRLLGPAGFEQPLKVLDDCRIRWGSVLTVAADRIEVRCSRLTWTGTRIELGDPTTEWVTRSTEDLGFVQGVEPGDQLALHWDWATDWLTDEQVQALRESTLRQLEVTNRRLHRQFTD